MATNEGPLMLRLSGGPRPYDLEVRDAETGRLLTNIEVLELAVSPDGIRATIGVRDAIVVDLAIDAADVETVAPIVLRRAG